MLSPILEGEEWRDVAGFEGEYSVSNFGRVRRDKTARRTYVGRMLKPYLTPAGYFTVALRARTRLIHRIVAAAFLQPDPHRLEINHKNGITIDNRVENLEWVTHAENMAHATAVLKRSGDRKLTEDQVREIRHRFAQGGIPRYKLAAEYGISGTHIGVIIKGTWWKHVK